MGEKPEKPGGTQRHCDAVVMQELTFPKALTLEQIERLKGVSSAIHQLSSGGGNVSQKSHVKRSSEFMFKTE